MHHVHFADHTILVWPVAYFDSFFTSKNTDQGFQISPCAPVCSTLALQVCHVFIRDGVDNLLYGRQPCHAIFENLVSQI